MTAAAMSEPSGMQAHNHPSGPGIVSQPMQTMNRLAEPGSGLEDAHHRVLTYAQLRSREPNLDLRPPPPAAKSNST